MFNKLSLALLSLLTFNMLALSDDRAMKMSPVPDLPSITRGQTVAVTGECLPKQNVKVLLRTGKETASDEGIALDSNVTDDGKSLSFQIPKESFNTGRYLVFVTSDSKELPVPVGLRVVSDGPARPKSSSSLEDHTTIPVQMGCLWRTK